MYRPLVLVLPFLVICSAVPADAERHPPLIYASSMSGQPQVALSRGEKVLLKDKRVMRPGDRLFTNEGARAVIEFKRQPACRIFLEPNSSFRFLGIEPDDTYLAELDKGFLQCKESSCGLKLVFLTPAGKLSGKGAEFALQAHPQAVTVTLKRGAMRLLLDGHSVALREMTRTTLSRTGSHRIAALHGEEIFIPREPEDSPFLGGMVPPLPVSTPRSP